MGHVAGRVVLITGGNAGIGRAAAIEFAKRGARVVVSGRREREGQEVVAGIKASGGEAIFVRADVSKERDVQAALVGQSEGVDVAVGDDQQAMSGPMSERLTRLEASVEELRHFIGPRNREEPARPQPVDDDSDGS